MKSLALCVGPIALFASSAHAQNLIALEPSSSWAMVSENDSCAMRRQFGDQGQQAFLELREFGDRDRRIQFTVTSKDFQRRDDSPKVAINPLETEPTERLGVNVHVDSSGGKLFVSNIGGNDPRMLAAYRDFVATTSALTQGQRELVLQAVDNLRDYRIVSRLLQNEEYQTATHLVNEVFQVSPAYLDHLARVQSEVEGIRIEGAFDRDLYLHTGELRTAMQSMQQCLEQLYSRWGIDPETHRSLSRPATPLNFNEFFEPVFAVYRRAMLGKRLEGYFHVRLNVASDGRPSACHLQSPLNDQAFDRAVCRHLMQAAKFSHASDASGQPVPSFYRTSVIYILPASAR